MSVAEPSSRCPDKKRNRQSPLHDDDREDDTHSPGADAGGSTSTNCKSTSFDFLSRSRADKERKQEARRKFKEIVKQAKLLKIEADLDSDDSEIPDMEVRTGKRKTVYQKTPIKPEKFPCKDHPRWETWVKHFKNVVFANNWTDSEAIAALATCLTSWAIDEFETVPSRYIRREIGCDPPTLEELLEVLKPKMQQYRSQRATRTEFKAAKQFENEDLRDFSRRVRHLGDIAFSDQPLREREREMRDQFLEGLFDSRLQQKLYEDERDRNFYETLQRAQELEVIQKSAESRRDRKSDKMRYSRDEADPSELVRAGYSNHHQLEENFAAIQTSMQNIASRFDRFENTLSQQSAQQLEQICSAVGKTIRTDVSAN